MHGGLRSVSAGFVGCSCCSTKRCRVESEMSVLYVRDRDFDRWWTARRRSASNTNFKPGTLESLGLGYESLHAINPGIVVVESSVPGSHSDEHAFREEDIQRLESRVEMNEVVVRSSAVQRLPCEGPRRFTGDRSDDLGWPHVGQGPLSVPIESCPRSRPPAVRSVSAFRNFRWRAVRHSLSPTTARTRGSTAARASCSKDRVEVLQFVGQSVINTSPDPRIDRSPVVITMQVAGWPAEWNCLSGLDAGRGRHGDIRT
jgi:hypothetical protein